MSDSHRLTGRNGSRHWDLDARAGAVIVAISVPGVARVHDENLGRTSMRPGAARWGIWEGKDGVESYFGAGVTVRPSHASWHRATWIAIGTFFARTLQRRSPASRSPAAVSLLLQLDPGCGGKEGPK